MRAVEVRRFGGPEVLVPTERPDPAAGPGEVVVAVEAADVLMVDLLIRSGWGADRFKVRPPYVPGNGVGGTVIEIGDRVDERWLGRRVTAHTGGPGGSGGYTERAVASVDLLTPVPDDLAIADAVAAIHDGPTALRICELMAVRPGERALVLGAAGGMGLLLVQLLRAAGAQVVGAARGPAKLDLARGAGAHAVVDYSDPGWTEAVLDATAGAGPDVLLDGVGGELGADAFAVVAAGGRVSLHGAASGGFAPVDQQEARRRGLTVRTIADLQFDGPTRARLTRQALGEVAAGRLNLRVGQTFPLAEASAAHAAMEARAALAKTLLTVPPRAA